MSVQQESVSPPFLLHLRFQFSTVDSVTHSATIPATAPPDSYSRSRVSKLLAPSRLPIARASCHRGGNPALRCRPCSAADQCGCLRPPVAVPSREHKPAPQCSAALERYL